MSEALWYQAKRCRNCGKEFVVLYPHLWRYKRGGPSQRDWFCTWGCLRAWEEGKEAKQMTPMKMTKDQIAKAVEIALEGGNPLPYLKEVGCKNPSTSWKSIRNYAKKNYDPEIWEKLPETFRKKAEEQPAEERPKVTLVYDQSIEEEYRKEQAAKADEEARAIVPLQPASLWSRVLQDGTFKKVNGIGMVLQGMNYQLMLSASEWMQLTEEIKVAIRQLGADEQN